MKTNRIQFSLEKYESGKYKVVTRDGRRARIVCTDLKGKQPIIAIIKLNEEESYSSFSIDGSLWRDDEKNDDCDLFLEEVVFEDGDIVSFADGYAIGIFKEINI